MSRPISIIVPTLNEQHYLPLLLDSIIRQKYAGEFEVLVVDGESADQTVRAAESYRQKLPQLRIVRSRRGKSGQLNRGVVEAHYDSLIFLDADTVLAAGAMSRMARQFARGGDFVALPLILPRDGKLIDFASTVLAYSYFELVRWAWPITSGMCIMTTRRNHDRVGGFNQLAVVAEDIDYGLRSVRTGAKYRLPLSVVVWASTRRFGRTGRIKLGLMWLRWHWRVVRRGPITDASEYDYRYGEF
jgi:glycosyltransferase involved in cell wall biosynthesis